ncbi:MAG: LptF/LptG family permease [Spirochaetes bacterium]|nr:LptF/LptG family permease [Spirochaetota bacterium]
MTKGGRSEKRSWASVPLRVIGYIGRSYVFSFALSFLFFFVVFFINQILLLAEDILSKNAHLDQTLLLLLYSLPSIVAIAFPFSALSGALMTSAGMNTDREILAFSAAGVSPRTIYAPFILIGALASLLSFAANDYFLPRSSKDFRALYGQMVSHSASIELKPYSVTRYSQAVVVTGGKVGDKAGEVLIFESGEGRKRTLVLDPSGESARIDMEDVLEQSITAQEQDRFSMMKAGSLTYRFAIREPIVGFSGGSNPSEMTSLALNMNIKKKRSVLALREADAEVQCSATRANLVAVYGALVDGRKVEDFATSEVDKNASGRKGAPDRKNDAAAVSGPVSSDKRISKAVSDLKQAAASVPVDRTIQIYELEYNKKFAIPAAGLFFSLLAFPLGLGAKRAGRTAGFGTALLLSTIYWGALIVGQTAGLRNLMTPWIAMWLPDILVFVATLAAWAYRLHGSRRSV